MKRAKTFTRPVVRRGERRGSALLENALAMTAFMMMFLGIIDFGRAVYAYNTVEFAARESAHYASMHGELSATPVTAATILTTAKNWMVGLDNLSSTTVTMTPATGTSMAPGRPASGSTTSSMPGTRNRASISA